ncbi:hypothetical protein Psuf_075720 [Phytohabitans suffuscus]|uniref:Uncharacterized protein n=1 Tax=Phytohabitans suffuscus TaxID=624315 RepID=A0A6F8YW03_9ACTN|nr:hypothetical protein [Phytohabitans suffuscus]BCB90259.1 hypothetical protein Psuf_075720 [Phytohabitans suffuscus]
MTTARSDSARVTPSRLTRTWREDGSASTRWYGSRTWATAGMSSSYHWSIARQYSAMWPLMRLASNGGAGYAIAARSTSRSPTRRSHSWLSPSAADGTPAGPATSRSVRTSAVGKKQRGSRPGSWTSWPCVESTTVSPARTPRIRRGYGSISTIPGAKTPAGE